MLPTFAANLCSRTFLQATKTYWALGGLVLSLVCSPLKLGGVRGMSMEPAYHPGSFYVLNRLSSSSLRRGDVVVFRQNGETCIKRIAAVGGDTLYLLRRRGYDDSELVMDWQVRRVRLVTSRGLCKGMLHLVACRVPSDCYFVLGDNLNVSMDSRFYGPIPAGHILGKVLFAPAAEPDFDHLAGHFNSAPPHGNLVRGDNRITAG